jgi:hypothetical protein
MSKDGFALLTGFGPGKTADSLLPATSAESGYVRMLLSFGPIYVIVYLGLLISVYRIASKWKKQLLINGSDGLSIVLATLVMISTVALGIMTLIHSYHRAAGVAHYYWIVVASMMVLQNLSKEIEKQEGK